MEAFSLTALSGRVVTRIIRVVRRGTHIRRGRRAAFRYASTRLKNRGWQDQDIRQFWQNCCDMANLELHAEEHP